MEDIYPHELDFLLDSRAWIFGFLKEPHEWLEKHNPFICSDLHSHPIHVSLLQPIKREIDVGLRIFPVSLRLRSFFEINGKPRLPRILDQN